MSQIEELRKIIVGDNSDQLSELKQRIEDIDSRTKDVAEVLAPAIKERIRQDDQLTQALEEPVAEGLKQAIRREPAAYADILYPVMSPAIRLAIADAISSLLSTINQTIESATSVQGLKTRFEALRTGVPYAELALRRSLLYRVEHVFLIERDTGLLIAELQNHDVKTLDSDAVSAMFSAIQSFVQDSFSQNDQDRLTDVTVGEHKVWVTHGPKAMLACIIRGDAPASLRSQLHDVLDRIRTKFAEPLAQFQGDNSEFVGIEDDLKPCLQLELKEAESSSKKLSIGTWVLLAVLTLGLLYGAYQWANKHQRLNNIRQVLHQTPGLLVTHAIWKNGKLFVKGLKDPMSDTPLPELKKYQIEEEDLVWQTKPFQSLETELVIKRFSQSFDLPNGIELELDNGVLSLLGEANMAWSTQFEEKKLLPSGVERIDLSQLTVSSDSLFAYIEQNIGVPKGLDLTYDGNVLTVDGNASFIWLQELKTLLKNNRWVNKINGNQRAQRQLLINGIESTVVLFDGKTVLAQSSQATLAKVVEQIKQLIAMIDVDNESIQINISGNADGAAQLSSNRLLRKQRAELVRDLFVEQAVDSSYLKISDESGFDERSARFKVAVVATK